MALDGDGPVSPARAAGLAYVCDHDPGLSRVTSSKGFHYLDASDEPIGDPETLERIRHLAIPPAWTDV